MNRFHRTLIGINEVGLGDDPEGCVTIIFMVILVTMLCFSASKILYSSLSPLVLNVLTARVVLANLRLWFCLLL